ncbi:MAG: gas vesicle protein K, partial [bacterium]|nr:gas vesicle protein K [bacterium]
DANPKNVEKGLAKLVHTLVELIRKLLEKQAMRRIEGGSLTEDEIERVGETLMKLENKMQELKGIFGLTDEELNLNLGPLGDLM